MMKLKARFNLWKLKKSSSPSMAFKFGLRKELDAAWDAKYGSTHWYQLVALHKVGAFAVVIFLLTASGGAFAYNSPKVTVGTALFTVKEAIEKVEEITRVTPESKAKFYLKKIERREAEEEVIKKKMPVVEIRKENKNIEKDVDVDVKVETKKKLKVEVGERKIRRTEKSIERAEEQLEKARQVMEKTESKNIKLREEIKFKVEERIEKRKKQLEIKIEEQKEKQEDLKGEKQIRINEGLEKRSQIKEVLN